MSLAPRAPKGLLLLLLSSAAAAASDQSPDVSEDPFADVKPLQEKHDIAVEKSWIENIFVENFGFRREIMAEAGVDSGTSVASRQSIGFETQKKFSSATATYAALDLQMRLVRRDGFIGFPNDMEGMDRKGWFLEYHNAYLDAYDVLAPLLPDTQKATHMGRFNARLGRFYLPIGLNLQTDTHGTALQLSNEEAFGFERDWYGGLWGNINEHLRYDCYYLLGSGYEPKLHGQKGLLATRIGLTDRYAFLYGFEGGASFISGERLNAQNQRVSLMRSALDSRMRHVLGPGVITVLGEVSLGKELAEAPVARGDMAMPSASAHPNRALTQLYQGEYLLGSRRLGVSGQYRSISRERRALLAELSWYLRNDVAGANLHWIKLVYEHRYQHPKGEANALWTLQYYHYW